MPIDNAERERCRACLMAHLQAELQHDIGGVLKTFSGTTEMIYNGQSFRDHAHIAQAHAYIGFSGDGAFEGLSAILDRESFTDDEIVVESRLVGKHVREFQGFAPTGRQVELPGVAFYRFDPAGKLISERIVMNLGTLGALPTWQPK
jgi:hypothetical protein